MQAREYFALESVEAKPKPTIASNFHDLNSYKYCLFFQSLQIQMNVKTTTAVVNRSVKIP